MPILFLQLAVAEVRGDWPIVPMCHPGSIPWQTKGLWFLCQQQKPSGNQAHAGFPEGALPFRIARSLLEWHGGQFESP